MTTNNQVKFLTHLLRTTAMLRSLAAEVRYDLIGTVPPSDERVPKSAHIDTEPTAVSYTDTVEHYSVRIAEQISGLEAELRYLREFVNHKTQDPIPGTANTKAY